MECTASITSFHGVHLMTKSNSAGISRVRTGARSKQIALKTATTITAIHSQYTPHSSFSSSLYDVLSVSPNVSARDIKSAYRRMALKYHPDVCPPSEKEECSRLFLQLQEAYEECSRLFLQLQEAYETLSDPLLRQDYDWRLQNMFTVGGYEGRLGSSHVWEAQLMELIRRRSGNKSSWGSRMRRRNQQAAYAAAAASC